MLGILTAITFVVSLTPLASLIGLEAFSWAHSLGVAGISILTAGIFGGLLDMGHEKTAQSVLASPRAVSVNVPAQGRNVEINVAPDLAEDVAPERATNWTERTGRNAGATTQIDRILADGAMTDRDRASAILAAREATAAESGRG